MPRTIWKFPLARIGAQEVLMPAGAIMRHVAEQHDALCLWAEVDPNGSLQPRPLNIYGTGHTMPDNPGRHLGTFFMHGGALVFHAYDPAES